VTTKKKTIFISGGGTGGHIWPLISIAPKIKKDYKLYFVGQINGSEEKIAQKNKIDFLGMRTAKLQGLSKINPLTYIKLFLGICQSIGHINKHSPKLIVAKGGYVSFPVALAGYLKGVKVIIHESDSVIGKTNRILSRVAFRFLTGFPVEYYPAIYRKNMIEVGIPTRSEFKESDLPHQKNILFVGGSQGSSFINQFVVENAEKITREASITHICGEDNYQEIKEKYSLLGDKIKNKYQLISFTDKIAELVKESTLVVSRAGATTVAEVARIKRPMILIPFPYATADHQLKNAQIIESKEAGILIEEKKIKKKGPELLLGQIENTLGDYQKRLKLADNLNDFMVKDSGDRIVKIIKSIIQ
jgi:UDP-N-acetylglucosamine--N-acetylmuramyl-(pentapeptide) pyrophosphoryl-undecaprenol N-acetylglucosamine transferase